MHKAIQALSWPRRKHAALILVLLAASCAVSFALGATVARAVRIRPVLLEPLDIGLDIPEEFFDVPAGPAHSLVEVCDFECPYSARVHTALDSLRRRYGTQMRTAFIAYPRGDSARKHVYGRALCAAADQHAAAGLIASLFALAPWRLNQGSDDAMALASVFRAADACSLNLDRFEQSLQSAAVRRRYQRATAAVMAAGIMATPTVFIDGYRVESALPYDVYLKVMEKIATRPGAMESKVVCVQ